MPRPFRPRLEPVEDRVTPAFPAAVPDGAAVIPVGDGSGRVRVIDPADGTDLGSFLPFPTRSPARPGPPPVT